MTRLRVSVIVALSLGACTTDSAPGAKVEAKGGGGPVEPPSDPELAADGQPLGRLGPAEWIDLRAIINHSPAEVDAVLGEPTETGSDRISCVRFVPERVFFACTQELRLYAHPHFESIRVEFEDGHAAVIALSGLPGTGDFDTTAALSSVGLQLPSEPRHDNPEPSRGGAAGDVVDRWEWGNSRARLLIDGLEHRVRLSVVNGEWRRAKLELINNNPLDPDQTARIKLPRGAEPSGG